MQTLTQTTFLVKIGAFTKDIELNVGLVPRKTTVLLALAQELRRMQGLPATEHGAAIMEDCQSIVDAIMETAPSGSGFDAGTQIKSLSHDGILSFKTSFHHMHGSGAYDGWTEHHIHVSLGFGGIVVKVVGRNKDDIKPYIQEVFHEWLDSECVLGTPEKPHHETIYDIVTEAVAKAREVLKTPIQVYERENPGSTIDSAIPQGWSDKFRENTGTQPLGYCWLYDAESRHGRPFNVRAWASLRALEHLNGFG